MAGSESEPAGPPEQPAPPEQLAPPEQSAVRTALIAETGRKSSVLWVRYPGSERARPAWHGWIGDAVVLVAAREPDAAASTAPSASAGTVAEDGSEPSAEQPLPGLAAAEYAEVTARSKDGRQRLLTWRARVRVLSPGSEEWDAACAVLGKERLNTTATIDQLPWLWADTAYVIRLEPTGEVSEEPGAMTAESGAAPPPPTPATTTGRLPWVLGRRARSSQRLS